METTPNDYDVVHLIKGPTIESVTFRKKNMTANNTQIGGDHYQAPIQTWDYIIAQNLGYLEGNIIKYVSRWKKKNGLEDLKKARHYLDKLIETAEQQAGTPGQP